MYHTACTNLCIPHTTHPHMPPTLHTLTHALPIYTHTCITHTTHHHTRTTHTIHPHTYTTLHAHPHSYHPCYTPSHAPPTLTHAQRSTCVMLVNASPKHSFTICARQTASLIVSHAMSMATYMCEPYESSVVNLDCSTTFVFAWNDFESSRSSIPCLDSPVSQPLPVSHSLTLTLTLILTQQNRGLSCLTLTISIHAVHVLEVRVCLIIGTGSSTHPRR